MQENKNNAKIYICAPADTYSGGPELLHQLCFKLRQYGYDALMWYFPRNGELGRVIHPLFEHYGNPGRLIFDVYENSQGYCVFPEMAINTNEVRIFCRI